MACQQRRDHLLLAGAERGVAEGTIEDGLEVVGHRGASMRNEALNIYFCTVSVKLGGSLASAARLARYDREHVLLDISQRERHEGLPAFSSELRSKRGHGWRSAADTQ